MSDKLYTPQQAKRMTFSGANESEAVSAMTAYFQRHKMTTPKDWQVEDKRWVIEISVPESEKAK
jgi:hypothetical protein